ncbi:MAG: hypothetical protein A2275_15190 [Bacteroidetes bacterium RIFOXYA12_FULL_35_11]|nr:MAG: hypothetical protein A2X01_18095 [Bacteroidetes bacterium GWF2_35_48]OFY80210.1 MAG: hypothetical protein A2275_15190 [Bacteroidetes bacterium RIFOXYA12_FULL_35_11]OFY95013.1 MAG: hypothetical protein A2491_16885 [Bacteroidetes bacterium RIFOXYC12_FULL_35_7]OFY97097.1 MAG: hypothetical protein A2309_01900 [Bacteroidetes bacterium RIFOXYB2_FULL_35_7]
MCSIKFIQNNAYPINNVFGISQNDKNVIELVSTEDLFNFTLKNKEDCEKQDLLIINTHLKSNDCPHLQDNGGIVLLKFLRLLGVKTHCILFSFLTTEQLLDKNPGNLIITSKGTTLATLRNIKVIKEKFNNLKTILADEDLKPYFKVDFQMPEEGRHNWANWWGIYKCAKEFANKTNSPFNLSIIKNDYPEVYKQIIKLDSLRALYLYANLNDLFSDKQGSPQVTTKNSELKIVFIDDQAEDGWSTIFQKMIYGEINKNFNPILANNIKEVIKEVNALTKFSTYKEKNDAINLLNLKDDVDIVLLDLRLDIDNDNNKPIKDISGIKVLQIIREIFPGLPIIVTTASNKSENYQEIIALGADACWIKEGIDNTSQLNEENSKQWSLKNYEKFIELLLRLQKSDYKFLKFFVNSINEIKKNKDPWWKNINKKSISINDDKRQIIFNSRKISVAQISGSIFYKSEISEILEYSVLLYRKYLISKDTENKKWLLCNAVTSMAGTIERIYSYENDKMIIDVLKGSQIAKTTKLYDNYASILLAFRGKVSHYPINKNLTEDLFFEFTSFILQYLKQDNPAKKSLKVPNSFNYFIF